jgi:uncharacterized protein (DUF302 family)
MAIEQTSVGLRITVSLPYEEAVEKTVAALKTEGFGVLTSIDVKQTMRGKTGRGVSPYTLS